MARTNKLKMKQVNHPHLYHTWENNSQKILIVNCGSSSVKLTVFKIENHSIYRLLDAHFKSLHSKQPILEIEQAKGKEKVTFDKELSITATLTIFFENLKKQFSYDLGSLAAIGHRFVHGGNKFQATTQINETVIKDLKKLSDLAPLHNEACLEGIEACFHKDKTTPQFAIFDTSFYSHLPALASHYAIPLDLYEKQGIKRYGFHGISHSFLWNIYNKKLNKNGAKNILTLHLGNGCSITATSNGKPIDTSMGFTPAEGLIMATRAGDIDAGVMEYLHRMNHQSPEEIMNLYNYQSGLLGISGISSKMEDLIQQYSKNSNAQLAVDMFCYRILKYIGAYIAILQKVDAFIFSGGIGENSPEIREKILKNMVWYGTKIDENLNKEVGLLDPGAWKEISHSDSQVPVYVVATDENLAMANEIKEWIKVPS